MNRTRIVLLACSCALAFGLAGCANGELEKENETLAADLEYITAKYESTLNDLNAANSDIEAAQADLAAMTAERDQLADDNEKISADLDGMIVKRDQAAAESEQLSADVAQLSADIEAVTAERDQVVAELESTTAERDQVAAELDQAAADNEQLAANIEQLSAERDEASAASEELSANVALLTDNVDAITAERDQLAADIEALTTERDQLVSEVDGLTAERDQLAAEKDEIAASIEELAATVEALTAERDQAAADKDEMAADVEALTAERDQALVDNDELAANIEELSAGIEELATERDQALEDLETLRAEFDAIVATEPEPEPQSGDGQQPEGQADNSASPFVGTWQLVEMNDGVEVTGTEDIEMLAGLGMYAYLNLNEDGTSEVVLFGESMPGTWESEDDLNGTLTIGGQSVYMSVEEGRLTISDAGQTLSFEQDAYDIEMVEPMPMGPDDGDGRGVPEPTEPPASAPSAFLGHWELAGGDTPDGSFGTEEAAELAEQGVIYTFDVNEDGSAVLATPEATFSGIWEDAGDGTGVFMAEGDTIALSVTDGTLAISEGGTTLYFAPQTNGLEGTWELVEAKVGDGSITLDEIQKLAAVGLYAYLDIAGDGAADLSILGGSAPAAIELVDTEGTFVINGVTFAAACDGNRLTISRNDKSLVFERDAYEVVKASPKRALDVTGQTIIDDDLVTVEVLGLRTDSWGDSGYDLRVTNNSDKTIRFHVDYRTWAVDGKMMDPYVSMTILPGAYAEDFLYFDKDDLGSESTDALVNVVGAFEVTDDETYDELGRYTVEL